MTTRDVRNYYPCPVCPTGDTRDACGEAIQVTVERWGHVLEDGSVTFETGIGAGGGGMLRIYCVHDHVLGSHDLEAEDFTETGAVRADVVSECLAEYEVTDRSRA